MAWAFNGFWNHMYQIPRGQMPHPPDKEPEQMPWGSSGGMGTGGIDWCISHLAQGVCDKPVDSVEWVWMDLPANPPPPPKKKIK